MCKQSWAGGSHCFETVTITINGKTARAQIVDRVSYSLGSIFFISAIDNGYSVWAVALRTWISVLASSTILEVLRRKVSCMEPGITAVKSPSLIQYPRQLRLPSQNPPQPAQAPAPAPVRVVRAPRLLPAPRNRPRPVVLVPLRLLPLVPMSLPRLLLESLPKVCLHWVDLVN